MALPHRVLALHTAPEPHVQSCLTRWEAVGVSVATLAAGSPAALLKGLDETAADSLAVWGAEPWVLHGIARSSRHARTPVTIFLEGEEGVVSPHHLDAPFWAQPLAPAAPPPDWDEMMRRAVFCGRFHFVLRSDWHAFALERRLGLKLGATIAPPALPAEAPTPRRRARRILFPGTVAGARRHGADLFVRTALELMRREQQALEFVVATENVEDPRVLAPLGAALVQCPREEALGTSTFALVTARGGLGLHDAVGCIGAGLQVLALQHPVNDELFHESTGLTEDPGANADFVRALLLDPARRAERQRRILKRVAARCAADVTTRLELERPARPARRRAPRSAPPLLTVAVPAYNAAPFLERCVESLATGQSEAGGLEVLIVDDGSTDDTAEIADNLARQHRCVSVIHQVNAGHGGAINTALRATRGTYFRVVDADDWLEPLALHQLLTALRVEGADLVLTGYAEDRPNQPLPVAIDLLSRLPPGALCRFDTILDPLYGLTSWGPILSTSTFRTACLREAGLELTEKSAYVDLEYCTLGLEHVETMRHLPLDLYRYSMSVEGQSVSPESYRRRFREHERVIFRLCDFVTATPTLSEVKRRYIRERVIAPVVRTHLDIVGTLLRDLREERDFRRRLATRFPTIELPPRERGRDARVAVRSTLKAVLPAPLSERLRGKTGLEVARAVSDYVLPEVFARRLRG